MKISYFRCDKCTLTIIIAMFIFLKYYCFKSWDDMRLGTLAGLLLLVVMTRGLEDPWPGRHL